MVDVRYRATGWDNYTVAANTRVVFTWDGENVTLAPSPVPSVEDQALRVVQLEAERRTDREVRLVWEHRQREARARARQLLQDVLSDAQRECYNRYGWFIVDASDGYRYVICYGYSGNVARLSRQGLAVLAFCRHLPGQVPYEDTMVAQKLQLETNAPAFVAGSYPAPFPIGQRFVA